MMQKNQIITTKDGYKTLFSEQYHEPYHSQNGAIAEANLVYINAGLDYFIKNNTQNSYSVFELGFGTGLNAWLSAIYATENNVTVNYVGLEKYPIETTVVNELNYVNHAPSYSNLFCEINEVKWNENVDINSFFSLTKINQDITEFSFAENSFDVIYFDAFSPAHQPEIWEKSIFEKLYFAMKNKAILTTYCSKGIVKRTLKELGFKVNALSGPPRKREMIRAEK